MAKSEYKDDDMRCGLAITTTPGPVQRVEKKCV